MNYTAEYPLNSDGIRKSILFIEEKLKEFRVKRRDLLEALLISEETLQLLIEHAPEKANIKVTVSQKMGVARIRLTVPGTPLALDEHLETVSIDQLGEEAEKAIRSVMLRNYADSIKYRHSRLGNSITIITGIPERILSTYTVAAIFWGVITFLLFRQFVPEAAMQWMIANL